MNRTLRRLAYRLLSPLDSFVRRINGKRDQPPLHLRWEVGPLGGFDRAGAEYLILLKLFANLTPQSRVLDIGSGCGQIALMLRDVLDDGGRYVGWDVSREGLRWCKRHLAAGDPRFSFEHLDVYNGRYNPRGRYSAATYRFPQTEPFDIIILKSVFTHMRKSEVQNYLSQLNELLKPDGKCVASFFLLNEHQANLAARGLNSINFGAVRNDEAHLDERVPEAVVAYPEEVVIGMLQANGLQLARPILYGTWAGERGNLTFQDILIVSRKA